MNDLTKTKAVCYLVAIFLAGAAAGTVIGYTTGKEKSHSPPPPKREMALFIRDDLTKRLQLTAEQVGKIQPIIEQTCSEVDVCQKESWKRVSESFKRMNQQIAAHLTEEQKKAFDDMERERRERRERHRNKEKDGKPPAPDKDKASAPDKAQ